MYNNLDLKKMKINKIYANLLLRKFSSCFVNVKFYFLRRIVLLCIVHLCGWTAPKWLGKY